MQQKLERKAPRLARFLKEIEIQFKWLVIWTFLLGLRSRSYRKKRPFDPRRVRRVLILRHDKIGDMVVTLSTIHTLKYYYPDIEIGVLASRANAMVIRNDPTVTFVHMYLKNLAGIIATYREIMLKHYDVVIDLMTGSSVTSLMLAMAASGGAYRIGTGKDGFFRYYDFYSFEEINHKQKLHISEVFRATLVPFGIPLERGIVDGKIQLSETERDRAAKIFDEIRERKYKQIIFLNASAGKLDRSWAPEKFIGLVGWLSVTYPEFQFVVSYAPNEIGLAKRAVAAGGTNVSLLPQGLSIIDIIGLLSHFDLVISVDTSICHIAAKLDVPLLAMYNGNNVNFSRWRPFGKRVWAVRSPDHKSVDGITLEQMEVAVENLFVELFNHSGRTTVA